MKKKALLGVVGATASGKTALAIALAKRLGGEIVCMDALQIYRGMDIGTAKPTQEEMQGVPHHMLDIVSPAQAYSVAQYREDAARCIRAIHARGALPLLVGGTGLYLQSLSLPMTYGGAPGDAAVRAKYQALCEREGAGALHALLKARDPAAAARLHENDVRRVVRALEVMELTGAPFSAQTMPDPSQGEWDMRLLAIDMPRASLYARIEQRVDCMLAGGLLREVEGLLAQGVPPGAQAMQGLGYKELIPVLRGETTLEAAGALLKQRTRNYAKRQLTWFRRDERIHWLPCEEDTPLAALAARALSWIGKE